MRSKRFAVEIFRQAERSGQLVSMSMINRVLEQLHAHRPTCSCGLCGETVAKPRADRAFRTASVWQRSVSAMRARAARPQLPCFRSSRTALAGTVPEEVRHDPHAFAVAMARLGVNGPEDQRFEQEVDEWETIDWRSCEEQVRRPENPAP